MVQNVIISLGHAVIDFYMNMLPSLMPFIMTKYGLTFTQVGLIIAVRAAAGSFTQPLFGLFVDRKGSGRTLILSLIWTSVIMSLIGVAPGYWWLLVITAFGPLACALYHPLGSALLREGSAPESVGTLTSLYIVAGSVGYALAPIVSVAIVSRLGLPGTLFLCIPGLAVAVVLIAMGVLDARLGRETAIPVEAASEKDGAKSIFDRSQWLASSGQVLMLSTTAILRSWAYVGLVNFLPIYYVSRGYSPEYGSYMLSLFLISGSVGTLLGGRLSDQWGRRPVTAGSLVLALFCLASYLHSSGAAEIILLAATGFTLLSSMSVTTVHAQELMVGHTGMAAGLMMGLVYGLGGIGASFSGRIADVYSLHTALLTLVVVLIPAIITVLVVPDPHLDALKSQEASSGV
ncbi:MAG: MFS transporter [Limnochordia bacterium]|nr:MFS transporter [Bacillota bacterium]